MILLTLAFLLLYGRSMNIRSLGIHVGAQLFLFLVIRIVLWLHFADNAGSEVEFHLFANMHTFLLGYSVQGVLTASAIGGLVFFRISEKHFALRKLVFLFAPFGVLVLFFGVITEVRAWLEVYPVLFFLCAHTVLFNLLKIPCVVVPLKIP